MLSYRTGDCDRGGNYTTGAVRKVSETMQEIMSHDNPVFYISSTNDLTFAKENSKRTGSGDRDIHRCTDAVIEKRNCRRMGCCRWRWNWFVNSLIILSICGMIAVMEFDILTFRPFGFYCKDPKISHKYSGDTIPFGYLLVITIFVPLIGICLVEMVLSNQRSLYNDEKKENLSGIKQAWFWYGKFIFGLLIVIFITEAGKSIVAEPRPHFFDTCKPDKAVNCTSGYVSEFKCTNLNIPKYLVKDSSRSFPSGHSSLGFYMSIFMIWFFQVRIPRNDFLLVPWLQCIFLFWGIVCSLTRITDHRHHWWDVLAGSICGVGVAVFTVKVLCRNFRYHLVRGMKQDKSINGGVNSTRHTSSRRLLSSTSSCGTPPDDRELREVQAT